jgi:hypothetical protein
MRPHPDSRDKNPDPLVDPAATEHQPHPGSMPEPVRRPAQNRAVTVALALVAGLVVLLIALVLL